VYHPSEPSTLVVSPFRTHSYIFQATDGYIECVFLGQFGDVVEKLANKDAVILLSDILSLGTAQAS